MKKIKEHKELATCILMIVFAIFTTMIFNQTIVHSLNLKQIPITNKYLKEGKEITKEDLMFVEIPNTILSENIYIDEIDIVGKVVDYGNSLAEGSLIYRDLIKEKSEVKNAGYFDLEEEELAVTLEVDKANTYANSIREGHNIDLYFSGTGIEAIDNQEKIIYGELVKQTKVLAIYNDSLESDGYKEGSTTYLVVALSYEDADLVGRAKEFGEVFPIMSYDAVHEVSNPTNYYDITKIKDAIYQRTIDITLKEIVLPDENIIE